MKRLLCMILTGLMLFSAAACTAAPEAAGTNHAPDPVKEPEPDDAPDAGIPAIGGYADFVKTLSAALVDGTANKNLSPISVYLALAMVTEGAVGDTQADLLKLLGCESIELRGVCGEMLNTLKTDAKDCVLYTKQVLPFTVYSAAVVGTLALMGDFGTALVFFAAYLVIAAIRTGSAALISLSAASAGGAAALVLRLRPYVAARFLSLGRAWQDPLGAGYQQVRAMSALASGGLFGRGAGRGWLSGVVAADTDLVFGLVCEELGLITGVCCLMCLLLLAVYARRNIGTGRSGGYAVAAAGAVTMFMVQAGLNVFGSMDMIPFTGVTFPFVSRGGSSLIACWGLLAVVKAADVLRPENTGKPAAAANKAAKTSAPKKTAEKKPASAAGKTGSAKKKNFGSKTAEKTQEKKTPAAKTKTAAVKKPVQKPAGTKGAQR